MALLKPVSDPVSQRFGGHFYAEPVGYFLNAADGRPLKAADSRFPGSYYAQDFHKGVDIYGALGTAMRAPEAGVVTLRDTTNGYLRIRIQGHSNVYVGFGHCDSIVVPLGAKVARGQIVAKMGKRGNATGVHLHLAVEIVEKGSDGVSRRMFYDPLRFLPAKSYAWGSPYGSGYLPGGDLAGDDRIYPIHSVIVAGPGTRIRSHPDTQAAIVQETTGPMTVSQLNVVGGGAWTVGGSSGTTWAKVKLANGTVAYVATALIRPA